MVVRLTGVAFGVLVSLSVALTASAAPLDQTVGQKLRINLDRLAAPNPDTERRPREMNFSRPRPRTADDIPNVPDGFSIGLFAEGLAHARNMVLAPNGDVFIAESTAGRITVMRDADQDGVADDVFTFVDNLNMPHGIAFTDDAILIGDKVGVHKYPHSADGSYSSSSSQLLTPLGALGPPDMRFHWARNVVVHPDGSRFYVGVGSASNIGENPLPHATIQEFPITGGPGRTFASGMRVPTGVLFYPGTTDLYTVVNERDRQGDELVPDYFTRVPEGAFFGWPYSYMGSYPQEGFADKRPDLVKSAIRPDVPFLAHSAALSFAFYTSDQFPEKYRGGAFVTLHGSWNANQPRGYTLVYAPFEDGKPTGGYEVFASGFWNGDSENSQVWGRPVGVVALSDGSLLLSDDVGQTVWRISYDG
ncbi:MAG: sorbosone dehydrogenase [Rhodospirillaceae bacterium]|jgi:glucose/arabinose dehydrogenase|nr:sorbosone dehydrogenase [Rhodospirillaceae bacterium]MBT5240840.1 sorbosone dehydrogenase [Rhodospirillaceae bacterium]MBT5564794.1 sorbosone dehydrogenase [Rhodospirillaceae bacterium]MBT6090177.1 sorbosone dehydrogenase [Rhodospirillaceae bacterium]MBT6962409.1 sorbosone dehydrogenase [Rhodospirillaceae bacterium]